MLDDTNGCPNPVETIAIPALTANAWNRVPLKIATPANCTAILSIGLALTVDKAAFVLYVDDVRAVKGKSYTVMGVRGVDEPDQLEHLALHNSYLDGSEDEQYVGFKRIIGVDFGVITTKADRVFLHDFFRATDKCLIYNGEEVSVVNAESSTFANQWVDNYEDAKAFTMTFREKTIQTTNPASWS
jgi:hypothetical protein